MKFCMFIINTSNDVYFYVPFGRKTDLIKSERKKKMKSVIVSLARNSKKIVLYLIYVQKN